MQEKKPCSRCHTCGYTLRYDVHTGTEWCSICKAYRFYASHDAQVANDDSPCPDWNRIIVGYRDPRNGGEIVVRLGDSRFEPSGKYSWEFEWGYGGSGPCELAWCLLTAILPHKVAEPLVQEFKWQVIANFPRTNWRISVDEITLFVNNLVKASEEAPR